jgi:HupE / UreJ protein
MTPMRGTCGGRLVAIVVALAAGAGGGTAAAHGIGVSQLRLRVDGANLDGAWAVHLADARRAVGLDPTLGGEPGYRELKGREASLAAYLTARLALDGDAGRCPLARNGGPLAWEPDLGEVRVPLAATCGAEPHRLSLHCDLLFDLDPRHRAYFSVEDARATSVGVLRSDRRSVVIDVRQLRPWSDFVEFAREGVAHIWSGLDHLLFLLALLLAAPLVRSGGGWSPRSGFGPVVREVLKVVTAFTAAHSVTLVSSFYGLLAPPARAVEVAIALSVFAAAWNNLRPFLAGRAWAIAGALGLVHGLGFAGALRNLSLPTHARGLALAAFNLGVELGQIVVVAAVLPPLYAISRRPFYARWVMGAGSLAIAWIAVIWVLERAFGLSLGGGASPAQ